MVPLTSLVLPILVSAVIVFVASSIFHMVLPLHKNDIRKVPQEDAALEAFRKLALAPGDYGMPLPGSHAGMKDPAFIAKAEKGPLVFMTVAAGSKPNMLPYLMQWFLYSVVISVFAGYIAGRALAPGVDYLQVFRFAGCTAFVGYAMGLPQQSIWYRRQWGATIRGMIDGLIYGLLTGGTFGWLWPR
ncbi:MAG: hypothetical protein A3H96_07965 [Acidobacteria bacterium RIFCSPLOWO2_02_FULL_67_36]|nr:MAG: hypothetical protein A3H96_07965 [Acidobacteria bacterium RIFCSPLOWO2_02_FULL_67_36]